MRPSKIIEEESKFSEKLTNTSRVKYSRIETTEIPGCEISHIRPKHDSYYYTHETNKNMIVIHSTVGGLRSDMAALSKANNHVSVSYVIARSGEVYELFDPKYWSYHLGRGAVGGNQRNSKRSIGIELSNYGPLDKVGNNLETVYSKVDYVDSKGRQKTTKRDVYCDLNETEHYTKVEGGYRGYEYFATFTDAQYDALNSLLDYLCKEYDIPRTFVNEPVRFDTFRVSTAKEFSGIATHVNFRKSGKWDLGPDFNWSRITDKVIELDEVTISPEPIEEVEVIEPELIEEVEEVMEEPPKKKSWWLSILSKLLGK